MSCYIIELADCALTPYAIETESGTEYGWGLMPKRNVDLDELLKIADMRKRNPSDSAERRFFMLVEQALGAHQ